MPTFIDSQCDLPLFASARRNDPETSKTAASMAGGVIADHERRILDALVVGPGSKDEIAERAGLSEQRVARRMAGLRRAGLVEATGIKRLSASGRPETVWRLAAAVIARTRGEWHERPIQTPEVAKKASSNT